MATRGGRVLTLVLALGLASTVGCGVKKTANRKTDGVIVQTKNNSQADIQKLFPDNTVSVVDRDEHLYKIKGAELSKVQERMPAAYAEEDLIINMDPSLDISSKELLAKRASIQEVITNLHCIKLKTGGPTAKVSLLSRPKLVGPNTVEIGTTIDFSASGSSGPVSSDPQDSWKDLFGMEKKSSPVDIHWIVEAPPASKAMNESEDKSVSVTMDRTGGYIVALLVQDPATGACDLAGNIIGATTNRPFDGGEGTKGQYSAEKFFHVPLVKADKAWNLSQGEGVTIAILDSGVNYNHPDLAENIKINEKEIPDNGIDDDGNGYVDDVYGWDFAMNDKYPYDDESHGTHVAGLAASSVSGIAKKAKILPIKAMLPTGNGTSSAIIAGIYYAVKQKVDIINMSLGGEGDASPLLLEAIKKAKDAGILVVAASGNETVDTDSTLSFLTNKDGSNVLAVAATDEFGQLTDYSNYGAKTVDIAAPGGTTEKPLVSTYSQTDLSSYIAYPGTSMASPVTAGAAALVKAVNPNLSPEQIKEVLMNSVQRVSGLSDKVVSHGLLDAEAAVMSAQNANILAAHN